VGTDGNLIWRTDGTPQGTASYSLHSSSGSAQVSALVPWNGWIYFIASGITGRPLWKIGAASPGPVAGDALSNVVPSQPDFLAAAGHTLFFRATDPAANVGAELYKITDSTSVARQFIFYNHSAFDGGDPAANASDDAAIAPDKSALRAGQQVSPANYTSYSRGINGVMIDMAGLTGGTTLTKDDFALRVGSARDATEWTAAPAPAEVLFRQGAGLLGWDRVTLTWPDGSILNEWLELTVRATAATGLAAPSVFYFGNLVGDVGDVADAPAVTTFDAMETRRHTRTRALASNKFDHNRDGVINVLDFVLSARNIGRRLVMPPAAPVGAPLAFAATNMTNGDRARDASTRRAVLGIRA
jgi:hypothetical protein